jgi:hypothetical protein
VTVPTIATLVARGDATTVGCASADAESALVEPTTDSAVAVVASAASAAVAAAAAAAAAATAFAFAPAERAGGAARAERRRAHAVFVAPTADGTACVLTRRAAGTGTLARRVAGAWTLGRRVTAAGMLAREDLRCRTCHSSGGAPAATGSAAPMSRLAVTALVARALDSVSAGSERPAPLRPAGAAPPVRLRGAGAGAGAGAPRERRRTAEAAPGRENHAASILNLALTEPTSTSDLNHTSWVFESSAFIREGSTGVCVAGGSRQTLPLS